jgi:alpha-amylase
VLSALGEADRMVVEQVDYDCDGRPELLIRTPHLCGIVSPSAGGALVELDAWMLPGNVLNAGTRRPEPWHAPLLRGEELPTPVAEAAPTLEIEDEEDAGEEDTGEDLDRPPAVAEKGLTARLHYDRFVRAGFRDHFLGPETELKNIVNGRFHEAGDFVGADYQLLKVEEGDGASAEVTLARDGNVNEGRSVRLVRVVKRLTFQRELPVVDVHYEVANRYHEPIRTRFAVGLDLNLDSARDQVFLETMDGGRLPLDAAGELADVSQIALVDANRGYRITLSMFQPARLWHFPILTVSRTPRGLATTFQGLALYAWWPMELWGQERARVEMSMQVEA